jgi:predicted ATP-dependent endonuclease of OLD family
MKLVLFNIENFRSIVHSGWRSLAHDNITALIGQNESGKTSVLEALYSFSTGLISEGVLRSDLSLPVVHCKFNLEGKKIPALINMQYVPDPIKDKIAESAEFILTRKWKEDRKSIVFISDESILNYYEAKEIQNAEKDEQIQQKIAETMAMGESIFKEMELAEVEKNESQMRLYESRKKLEECQKSLTKARKQDIQLIAQKNLEIAENEYNKAEETYRNCIDKFEIAKQKTQDISEQISISKTCHNLNNQLDNIKAEIESLKIQLKETEHQYEITTGDKELRLAFNKLDQIRNNLGILKNKFDTLQSEEELHKSIAYKIFAGINYRQAEAEAKQEIIFENSFYSIFDLGELLFKHIPIFEFFEDFSSLLPNKIDLEDILNENAQTEGYKAARNFLEIAGLNASFFREKNHRILKQKIENLNGEITIDFQDYWSQNVGKNNKIRLNFELEHYDYTHPEKSGKPYIEFWIKDKQERLYPKQRSRGVRWFLSFYLELKATARKNQIDRIMLIDEPGLSLHARAQEDVLKVFEDLKDKMQIIYCTHSPHLIDVKRLYRILAVQRANEDDDSSETVLLDTGALSSASSDTLSPVYSLMGVKLNSQNFISPKNNFIVEDTVTYYYLNILFLLSSIKKEVCFIPSTGLASMAALSNILTGWKINFNILLFGNINAQNSAEELKKSLFSTPNQTSENKILLVDEFEFPEDLFSTLDFKKLVLQKREGITEKNSSYINNNGLSRTILASQFINYCETKNLKLEDFDAETQRNIKMLTDRILTIIT